MTVETGFFTATARFHRIAFFTILFLCGQRLLTGC